jgi:polysaccharide export outer membrane protein
LKLVRNICKPTSTLATLGSIAGLALLAVIAAPALHAQEPAAPGLQTNPALTLRSFEPSPDQPYLLGRGDEISITFGSHPEMNSKQIVGPDGKITLPLAGSIQVADKTREQAADVIDMSLAPYFLGLSVTVGVDKYTSDQVLLLGAVERPGIQTFDRPPTLLEVISRGGAIQGTRIAHPDNAAYSMTSELQAPGFGVPERCAIYRGSDKVVWVDLKKLLDSGSSLADLRLQRDDIVYVPSAAERYVSMLGEVAHPGALQLDDSTTLIKLISLAGGLNPAAGRNAQIQIVSPSTGKTRIISWKQIMQPGALDLTLHSGDIVFVPQSGFNRVAYTLDKLSPLVTMFTASAVLTH